MFLWLRLFILFLRIKIKLGL